MRGENTYMKEHRETNEKDSNPDPITKAPGSHPAGTGAGAAAGGLAGAAIGTAVGGPVGGVVGSAIGAAAGGLAGKGVAEAVDPTSEEAYWHEEYRNRPYYDNSVPYEDISPAYRTGYMGYGSHPDRELFDDIEEELKSDYERNQSTRLPWAKARPAAKDAWERARRRPRS